MVTAHIVRHAPLVSIDIIIKDHEQNVLIGLRVNEPARGTYFVPGGIIRKNETIRDGFTRILNAEVGLQKSLDGAKFLDVFEHFYETNRFEEPTYGTHYVVIAYELTLRQRPAIKLDLTATLAGCQKPSFFWRQTFIRTRKLIFNRSSYLTASFITH
jgi:colanic acid biosynthesis protein WcaH